jgi:hypothetical protein
LLIQSIGWFLTVILGSYDGLYDYSRIIHQTLAAIIGRTHDPRKKPGQALDYIDIGIMGGKPNQL